MHFFFLQHSICFGSDLVSFLPCLCFFFVFFHLFCVLSLTLLLLCFNVSSYYAFCPYVWVLVFIHLSVSLFFGFCLPVCWNLPCILTLIHGLAQINILCLCPACYSVLVVIWSVNIVWANICLHCSRSSVLSNRCLCNSICRTERYTYDLFCIQTLLLCTSDEQWSCMESDLGKSS